MLFIKYGETNHPLIEFQPREKRFQENQLGFLGLFENNAPEFLANPLSCTKKTVNEFTVLSALRKATPLLVTTF